MKVHTSAGRDRPVVEVEDADVVGIGAVARVGGVGEGIALDDGPVGEELSAPSAAGGAGGGVEARLEVLLARLTKWRVPSGQSVVQWAAVRKVSSSIIVPLHTQSNRSGTPSPSLSHRAT